MSQLESKKNCVRILDRFIEGSFYGGDIGSECEAELFDQCLNLVNELRQGKISEREFKTTLTSLKTRLQRVPKRSKFDKVVIRLKEDNPQLTYRGILDRIDKMNERHTKIPWPKTWVGLGKHNLLVSLHDDPQYRVRIMGYISKKLTSQTSQ